MSFINELENEINVYIKNLDKLNCIDLKKVNAILNKYADELLQRKSKFETDKAEYEKQFSYFEQLEKLISERSSELNKFVRNNKKVLKKDIPFPDEVVKIQNDIDRLQNVINNFKGTKSVNLSGLKDYDALYQLRQEFAKSIEKLEKEISYVENTPLTSQVIFDDREYDIIAEYFDALKGVALNLIRPIEYFNLMCVFGLLIHDISFSAKWCHNLLKERGFSIECSQTFENIIRYYKVSFVNDVEPFINKDDNYRIVFCEEGIFIAKENDSRQTNKKIFSVKFLNDVLNLAKENSITDLPSLVIFLVNKYVKDIEKSNFISRIKQFKLLYLETPEQIQVRDQRYYEELRIYQEEQRQREMEREMERQERLREREMEREARWREEQLEIQRENARAEQRRWEENNRREDERRKEEEAAERRRQKQLQREKYNESMQEAKARNAAILRCTRCANYDSCGKARGTVNCGAFVAKR